MPIDILRKDKDINYQNFILISDILLKPKGKLLYKDLKPLNKPAQDTKIVKGKLIGGNLTLLTNSLNTGWQLNGKDKIIFIEDINSKGYVIDRDLNHLKQAGVFDRAKAVLFGEFVKGDDNKEYAIKSFSEAISIPVFYSDNFGHGKNNYPLPLGFQSYISADETSGLYQIGIDYDFTK